MWEFKIHEKLTTMFELSLYDSASTGVIFVFLSFSSFVSKNLRMHSKVAQQTTRIYSSQRQLVSLEFLIVRKATTSNRIVMTSSGLQIQPLDFSCSFELQPVIPFHWLSQESAHCQSERSLRFIKDWRNWIIIFEWGLLCLTWEFARCGGRSRKKGRKVGAARNYGGDRKQRMNVGGSPAHTQPVRPPTRTHY